MSTETIWTMSGDVDVEVAPTGRYATISEAKAAVEALAGSIESVLIATYARWADGAVSRLEYDPRDGMGAWLWRRLRGAS